MSEQSPPPPPPGRWQRFRPEPMTVAGIIVGVLLYLVFFVGLGDLTLGIGAIAVLALLALLARSIRAARDARARAAHREREWLGR